MRHIMHTVEHAALVQAAAYGKHRARPQEAHPCKIARRMRPCDLCRMELEHA